jgi:hypothetical protein
MLGGDDHHHMSTSSNDLEKKKQAALAFALGCTRGVLSQVLFGDFSREEVQRIYDATAMSRVAQSIGLTEADFDTDWSEHLTNAEQHKIKGYDTV